MQNLKYTIVILCGLQLIKDLVDFPPPVMFYLGEFCFSIMTITVWPICIGTFHLSSPWKQNKKLKTILIVFEALEEIQLYEWVLYFLLLIFFGISWTIIWRISWKFFRMCLNRIRIEYLHCFSKVHRKNQIIDGFIIEIMTKYYEGFFNSLSCWQTMN